MSQKPHVLIFGGLDRGTSSGLIQHLLPPIPAEPLVSFIRFVDKYSISPPTTYIPKDFLSLLNERKGFVEYKQFNLANPAVTQCFTPGADACPFTHVFDCSGSYSLTDIHEIQIAQTFNVSLNLAREAAHRHVRAYVRITPCFYEHLDQDAKYKETEAKGWIPLDVRGLWFHEAIRAIGSVPDLPLVVLRHAHVYGPGMANSAFVIGIVVGKIYKETKQTLTMHLPTKLRKNTVHLHDLAIAAWHSAEWVASINRENANAIAGTEIPPSGHAEATKARDAVPSSASVTVPTFNVVDSGDTIQEVTSGEVAKAFGITIGYSSHRLTDEQYQERIEDINGAHYGYWYEIINNSNPPIPNTPLSPYVTVKDLKESGCALDGSKIRQVLSFEPKYPRWSTETINQYISWCEAEGIWPK